MAVAVDLPLVDARGRPTRPDPVLATLPPAVWERRSCGSGTTGERYYDWAALPVTVTDQPPSDGYTHTLLVRRSISHPQEIEFFLAHAPAPTPVPELIAVAGMRWKVEENNEQGKDLARLGPIPGPQVDPLAPARDLQHARPRLPRCHPRPPGKTPPAPGGPDLLTPSPLIRLSLAEIRRLLARTHLAAAWGIDHILPHPALVTLPPPAPDPNPHQPLPQAGDPIPQELRCSTPRPLAVTAVTWRRPAQDVSPADLRSLFT